MQSDGYDIRIIVVGDMVFGYYRKAPDGDFRASGMGHVEKRALPPEAIKLALGVNEQLRFTMLVVDLLCDPKGTFHIIEFSPVCRIDTSEQLHLDGAPGAYVFDENREFRFVEGRFWVQELALRSFLEKNYLQA